MTREELHINEKCMDFYNSVIDETFKIQQKISEETDRFIYESIAGWYERDYQIIISKRLIVRALSYFKEHCPEEFEVLQKDVYER